jgi:hypothetical protein
VLATVPLRALSARAVPPATAPDEGFESDNVAPLEPLARFRVAEPSSRPLPSGANWERRAFRPLDEAGPEPRQGWSRPGSATVPLEGRLLYVLPAVPGTGDPALQFGTHAETQLAGHSTNPAGLDASQLGFGVCPELAHPMTARGEVTLAPLGGGPAWLRLRGAPPGTVALTNLPPAGDPQAPPWRERTYYRLEPGQKFTAALQRTASGRQSLNLGLLPIVGEDDPGPMVLTAELEGPASREGVLLSELTAAERTLQFTAGGESQTIFLDRPGPRVGRAWSHALALQDDRGAGEYRWRLRLTSGRGVLVRCFQMTPTRPGEGQLWVSSRL